MTLNDLAGKTVAVVTGAAIEEYLKTNYPAIELLGVDDELVGLTRVSFNQADAMVIEIARPVGTFSKRNSPIFILQGTPSIFMSLGLQCGAMSRN